MMGRIDNQMQLLILDLDSMIPENHLLRQIKNSVNFDFIYEKASSFYSHTGRKSIDPVVMIKMLLIGYLYGIKSERRLEEEVSLNLAYRWFCELDLMQKFLTIVLLAKIVGDILEIILFSEIFLMKS